MRSWVRTRGTSIAGLVLVILAVVAWLALPMRYEVEGVSMAPGIMPGDILQTGWFPKLGRRPPRRFECWLLDAPGGETAVKRVVGLPGEAVSIREGDLAIDGRVVLKSPSELAAVAMAVARHAVDARGAVQVPAAEVLDDADFATEVSRPLLPVHDGGLMAIVRLRAGRPGRVSIDVGQRRITWRLDRPGRVCIVAGRLDGHLVAVAWPLSARSATDRLAIPAAAPSTWSHAEPWPVATPEEAASPKLSLAIASSNGSLPHAVVVEQAIAWRDVLLRPAGDGREEWHLGADELLVLGDFPSGSRDSRHWGPVRESAFRSRLTRVEERRD